MQKVSEISKKRVNNPVSISLINPNVLELIKTKYPDLNESGYISQDELKDFRMEYIKNSLETDKGELSKLELNVIESLINRDLLSRNLEHSEDELTFGQRVADRVAEFGGSWSFIISFGVFIILWILANVILFSSGPFDPYPFILLNLMLSCLAALQAPVIMMSQNRQDEKDRIRSRNDYMVNLKAEMEIKALHEKLDYLIQKQWDRLLEIQQMQIDLLEEVKRNKK